MSAITQWLWTHPQVTWPALVAALAVYGICLYRVSPAVEDDDDEQW